MENKTSKNKYNYVFFLQYKKYTREIQKYSETSLVKIPACNICNFSVNLSQIYYIKLLY